MMMYYAHYIRINHLEDNKETYKEYLLKYDEFAQRMPPKMLKQYIDGTYRLRFINHDWC